MATAKKEPGTAVVKWADQLAAEAAIAAKTEAATGTSAYFSLKSGVLSFGGNPVPGNAMIVIITDYIMENVYYEGDYDQDALTPPTCFAFGTDDSMKPHDVVFENESNQHDKCQGCPMNEWGSAEKGKGKACSNKRRLAMIPAGTIENGKIKVFTKASQLEEAALGLMKLPVMSVKGFATFVKNAAIALKRPPHGIITKVSVVPDPKSQFRVVFEVVSEVPDEMMGAVMARREEAGAALTVPYSMEVEEREVKPAKFKGKGAAAPKGASAPKKK
jgi:hypothetical protein